MSETSSYTDSLRCNGRTKLPAGCFVDVSRFYRGYCLDDLEEDGSVKLETIQAPDLSCNSADWSTPHDVKFRLNGLTTDGCYSFSLVDVRFDNLANAVHAPLCDEEPENYSHVELRSLFDGEAVTFEPDAKRDRPKSKGAKKRRIAWRENLRLKLQIEVDATA